MNQKLVLSPDPDKHLYTIKIDVYENCQTMNILPHDPQQVVTWQSIMGAMDVQKTAFFLEQNTRNMEMWIEQKKKLHDTKIPDQSVKEIQEAATPATEEVQTPKLAPLVKPRSLRILFLGNFEAEFSSENYYKKTLEKMGHTIIPLQEGQSNKEQLLSHADIDLFFWVHTHGWQTPGIIEALQEFRSRGVTSFGYHLDLYMGLERWREYENGDYFKVDHFFTVDKLMADWLNSQGKTNGHYLPAAVYAGECFMGIPNKEKYPHDIIFTGAYHYHSEWPYRPQLIDWLKATYGNNFGHYGNGGMDVVRGPELNNLYASAKIVIGDTLCKGFDYPFYFSDRLFEVTGRGGFLIFPYIKGIGDIFNITGGPDHQLITYNFNHYDELKTKIDYYLDPLSDMERRSIVSAGQNHVIVHHTYTNRFEEILKVLGK